MYQYHSEESGFYRVYYKKDRKLYCIQNDGGWGRDDFKFYPCTREGEPEYEITFPDASEFDRLVYPDSLNKKA